MIILNFFLSNIYAFFFFLNLYIYLWLCGVFVSVRGLSPVVASGGHSSLRCAGLSPSRPLLLRSTGSRRAGSVIVAHGPSCSAACGIFPDQGSNPRPLYWQADSQPLRHQGSPQLIFWQRCRNISIGKEDCFQQMVVGQLNIYVQKNRAGTLPHNHTQKLTQNWSQTKCQK